MKKLYLIIILIITVFVMVGCSAMEEEPYNDLPHVYGNLYYDYETMTYNSIHSSDIFYNIGDVKEDFIILHQEMEGISYTSNEIDVYHAFFDKLLLLADATGQSVGVIMNYNSSDFKTALETHSIEVTLNDVVTFNDVKSALETYKSQNNNPSIRKIDYISYILDQELTNEDRDHLQFLQDEYLELVDRNIVLDLKTISYENLILSLESTGKTYTEIQLVSLKSAYDLLNLIYQRNS
ncbi:hypothetical protein BK010_09700 [Tenericutes bacterium MO-XQ]|nr:hypothetical protein BK010_09700 [Tenericutes bacterium MO-XQ]